MNYLFHYCDRKETVMQISTDPRRLILWEAYHLRYSKEFFENSLTPAVAAMHHSKKNSYIPEGKYDNNNEDDDDSVMDDERASSVFTRLRRDAMSREDAFKQKKHKLIALHQIPKEIKNSVSSAKSSNQ
mmetsp:Transcript_8407/g.13318  ORF Transcript_8407/g.13318 Transcript_8407/m.13318 type:complete len:129 (-) Transcript_8407:360-746(-)